MAVESGKKEGWWVRIRGAIPIREPVSAISPIARIRWIARLASVHEISRWFPSSKTCSCCGHKLDKLSLDVREWTCPDCGTHHDRDLNAAKNILNQGQRDLYDSIIPSRATMEEGSKIPKALKKHSFKIERSRIMNSSLNEEQASLTVFSC